MKEIRILERDMTDIEFSQMNKGFIDYELKQTGVNQTSERLGFVILEGSEFIGCSSGLVYKNGENYNDWCQLTDLFVEKKYRKQGLGKEVLVKLEEKLISLGIHNIWTWTDGYGAIGFYKKQGYEVFCELEKFYITGHNRIGISKNLERNKI
ncbi:MAG: GNAT family N-acetyltransferase [Promethearchaeota archaeon]|jgi:ribosomal protein S18 acetylase RimI-like enzyme